MDGVNGWRQRLSKAIILVFNEGKTQIYSFMGIYCNVYVCLVRELYGSTAGKMEIALREPAMFVLF